MNTAAAAHTETEVAQGMFNENAQRTVLNVLNFKERRGLPRKAKVYTIYCFWASLLFSAFRLQSLLFALALLTVGLGVSALIWSLKTLED